MSEIPADIIETATAIVDRIAKQHFLKGDCVADVAQALLTERQRHAEVKEEVRNEGRRQGLEEAAAWHEGKAEKFGELYHANKHNHVLSDKLAGDVIKHQAYASSIRALLSRLEER